MENVTAIIDYGSGNLKSVFNAFRHIGGNVKVCETPEDLDGASRIVLPGVGASRDAMEGLVSAGYVEKLVLNIKNKKPFLGICLGMQLLFEYSEEDNTRPCLGLFPGTVRRFEGPGLKIPQIGWNTVKRDPECPLFDGIPEEEYFYFAHSYYCPRDTAYASGVTEYGGEYTSALRKENIFAVQFHPERSQSQGIKILRNFLKI